MEGSAAAAVAAFLAWVDLDRTFYTPRTAWRAVAPYWLLFAGLNGALAWLVYLAVGDAEALQRVNPWLRAVLLGCAYLAIVHVKLLTIRLDGRDVQIGLELLYEAVRQLFFSKINSITRLERIKERELFASSHSLKEIVKLIRDMIDEDALLDREAKTIDKAWVIRVVEDQKTNDDKKRVYWFDTTWLV